MASTFAAFKLCYNPNHTANASLYFTFKKLKVNGSKALIREREFFIWANDSQGVR